VLVVEDDGAIADAVAYALRRDGMGAQVAPTLDEARRTLPAVDAVVLDLGLPDGSGFSLIREAQALAEVPRVVVLTSRDEEVDCVAALEAGADDYVSKPFSPRALVARVRATLRRGARPGGMAGAAAASGQAPPAAGVTVDVERHRAGYAGRILELTRIEFELLRVLCETPGRVRTRTQLVERVWGNAYALTERTVDSHFKGLRRKLEEAGAPATTIETVRGVGFRLGEGAA
jgi:two-component system catabolic regulation response regulator CreB